MDYIVLPSVSDATNPRHMEQVMWMVNEQVELPFIRLGPLEMSTFSFTIDGSRAMHWNHCEPVGIELDCIEETMYAVDRIGYLPRVGHSN